MKSHSKCVLPLLAFFSCLMAMPCYVLAQSTPSFHAIEISGAVNVNIVSGQPRSQVRLTGDADSLAAVYTTVVNDTLYIGTEPTFIPTKSNYLLARISVPALHQLSYKGVGAVSGSKLSGLLDISDSGAGKVDLSGNIVLRNLLYNGSGALNISWINSSHVRINGLGQGKIFIAGIAGLLDVSLGKEVYLDAKYLRAHRVFVATNDASRADIWSRYSLSTWAKGFSRIYYYHDPILALGGYMQPPAAVVRMTNVDPLRSSKPPASC